ncbi:sugar transferase [Patiriisocius hiemis]|uniref:Sugar transferase n=1 Tax=Patiriisocius hiemis TaxID=3075604 RepID=A0ABU2YCW8_9FLAO|nr:sugar transferase [Constantimarinum sp. W242]MDT0556011.1 sugar transferase [Constantimarinum sp. W242]
MLTKKQKISKRFFDVILSFLMLPFVIIPLILLLIIASISTKQNGLFVQKRVGIYGSLFSFYKIRSLKGTWHEDIKAIKNSETPFGSWIRKTKLDELPQLFNVLKGDMSFVGPRPDIIGYADTLSNDDRIILSVRPGITGPATIKYKNEEEILLQQDNPKKYNDEVIWPDKVAINKEYVLTWSFTKDIYYLLKSL